jgi:hypothetical protein
VLSGPASPRIKLTLQGKKAIYDGEAAHTCCAAASIPGGMPPYWKQDLATVKLQTASNWANRGAIIGVSRSEK